ncbi:hypothetical protein HU200_049095 [Digitaria exilis]|uniref:RING-type domain-containing protein n=1 Tax=Digitaria exilis TaxID=1010633 RepID=A0A835AZR3_9POAL|nr:hypothetical protein HU200_049095 [Digitaria exilis]
MAKELGQCPRVDDHDEIYFCDRCWRDYIQEAINNRGLGCLSLRCPEYRLCQAAVVRELVDMVDVAASYKVNYDWYALRSFVDDSGGRIRWCPGCSIHGVEFVGGGGAGDSLDVLCRCNHSFCWN